MYAQYADKPKAVAWCGIIPSIASGLEQAYNDIKISYSIDDNTREQLNVIGRVVNVGITWETVASIVAGDNEIVEDAPTVNQLGYNQLGSFQLSPNVIGYNVIDDVYRRLIRSQISKNNSDSTIRGIIEALQFIFADNQVIIGDFENMEMDVSFLNPITPQQVGILKDFRFVPKPQGVRFRGYAVLSNLTIFGDPDSQFGDPDSQFGFYFGGY
jgi:hypothetical protein